MSEVSSNNTVSSVCDFAMTVLRYGFCIIRWTQLR